MSGAHQPARRSPTGFGLDQQEGRAGEAMVTRILDGTREEDSQAADMKQLCSHVAASTVLGACRMPPWGLR